MKIFVNARFLTQPVSGVQRYGIECSRQIKRLFDKATFLSPPDIIHTDIAEELNVKVVGRHKGHLWEQSDLPHFLKQNGVPPLLNLANTAPLRYKNNYVTIHDLAFHRHPEWNSKMFAAWYNFLMPRLAQGAKQIFTVSETIKSELVSCYKVATEKVSVTYNGISDEMKRVDWSTPKEKVILSVGTFNTRKNQQNLVKAFAGSELKNEYKLVLVGDRNKIFSESGLDVSGEENKDIIVLEHVSMADLKDWYGRAEVVVSLSQYEGFGIPLLEGLNYGCKILCSDIPVYRELYTGFADYCDPYDLDKIAAAMKKVTEQKRKYNEQMVNELLDKYNYETAARKILSAMGIMHMGR